MNLTPKTQLELTTQLVAGLLASGHYTKPPHYQNDEPEILKHDNGKDWKEKLESRRFHSHCVLDAEALLREVFQAMDDESISSAEGDVGAQK